MNGLEILSIYRGQLAQCVAARTSIPELRPLKVSPWIAMSALQKAIRRGQEETSLRAAATLLVNDPMRFWRRCGVIAFEDVGLADVDAIGVSVAALAGKRVRAELGGEWAVASAVISRLASAAKCRAADDLFTIIHSHRTLASARLGLSRRHPRELLAKATGSGSIEERALALSLSISSGHGSTHGSVTRRDPQAAFHFLCNEGFPHTVVEIAREGYRKTNELLCPLVALLSSEPRGEKTIVSDQFPAEAVVGDAPSWALDMFTREGKAAFSQFMKSDYRSARWIRSHIPPAKRIEFLGGIVFRVEGGLMKDRMRWPAGDELRRKMDVECNVDCRDASEILDLARDDIPLLNGFRASVIEGGSHA